MSLFRLVTLNLGNGIPKALKNLGHKNWRPTTLRAIQCGQQNKCNHLKYAKERKQNQNLL